MDVRACLTVNTTAQARAAHWMVEEDDDLHLDIPILNDEGAYRFLERYVMAVFHFALQEKQLWGRSLNFLGTISVAGTLLILPMVPSQNGPV